MKDFKEWGSTSDRLPGILEEAGNSSPSPCVCLWGTPHRRVHQSVACAAPGREVHADTLFYCLDICVNPGDCTSALPVSSHPLMHFLIFSVPRGFRRWCPPGTPARTESLHGDDFLTLSRKGQLPWRRLQVYDSALEEALGLEQSTIFKPRP